MTDYNGLSPQTALLDTDLLVKACQEAQARHELFTGAPAQPTTVVVAVSGGADSVALLHVLHRLATAWRLTLHIAHLDHNLRPTSAADADFVAQMAAQWQLPFHQQRLSPVTLTQSSEGVEAAGRRARYRFLAEVALAVTPLGQIPTIALAHHADDQAETLLLHLVRGSGLRGLGGMRWVSPRRVGDLWPAAPNESRQQTLHLIRPFLGVRRADLLRYLRTKGLLWREDSTNSDQQFIRNRLRHTVLPALATINPNVVQTLTRTAQILQQDIDRLAALDQAALVSLLVEPAWSHAELQTWHEQSQEEQIATAPKRVVLDADRLAILPMATQRGVVREASRLVAKPTVTPDFAQVEALLATVAPPLSASGPHPLFADLVWSMAGAFATTPARLSLHQEKALPFAPEAPFLDEQWRMQVGALSLPNEGVVPVANSWSLVVTRSPRQSLPTAWRNRLAPWQAYLDADQVGWPVLTTPHPGQRFAPLGMNGRHQSVGDFFTNRKVPVALRSGWPLIVDQQSGEVLWIGGYQPSHHARITEHTQSVLWLTWRQGERASR